jgi:hypothetical protein
VLIAASASAPPFIAATDRAGATPARVFEKAILSKSSWLREAEFGLRESEWN